MPGLTASFALVLASASMTFAPGDRVLAEWEQGLWYPGRVQVAGDGGYRIAYDDGDVATVPMSRVRALDWVAGTRVQCNFRNQGRYFPARIERIDGEEIVMAYDDGDREQATIGRCRQPR